MSNSYFSDCEGNNAPCYSQLEYEAIAKLSHTLFVVSAGNGALASHAASPAGGLPAPAVPGPRGWGLYWCCNLPCRRPLPLFIHPCADNAHTDSLPRDERSYPASYELPHIVTGGLQC